MKRSWFGSVLLAVLACAGSKEAGAPQSPAAEDTRAEATTEGQQCLADAEALREPRADAPSKIHVSHILVRHRDLKRPEGATRTREAACLRALEALSALQQGTSWDEVALKYSDAKNDALGRVSFDELTTEFANAAFALEANELSYVVETNRGFHIILRKQ